MTVIAIIQLT